MDFGKTSGAEMMLRAAGLGGVLDAANRLAQSGAIEKVLAFADQLPELLERLERIENELRELRTQSSGNLSVNAGTSPRKSRSGANGASHSLSIGQAGKDGESP